MDQENCERKLTLEVGKTKLFTFDRSYEGERYLLSVFYGNYVSPWPNDTIIHLDEETYKKTLIQFLNSKEGQKYIWPSEEEILEAQKLVISIEADEIRKRNETSSQNVQQEIIEKVPEQIISKTVDELELINLQKRVRVMLIIIVIQLLIIITLVALRIYG